MTGKIQAFVECQIDDCANVGSYPLDLVRKLKGLPICQNCYGYKPMESMPQWDDLPPVRLEDLKA